MIIRKANLIIDVVNLITTVIDCEKFDNVLAILIAIIVIALIYNAPKIIKAMRDK